MRLHKIFAVVLPLLALVLGAAQTVEQVKEETFIHDVASRVAASRSSRQSMEKILALRHFVRSHVSSADAPYSDDERPFLRSSAAEVLRSGKGYCGEDTRVFICLARAAGFPAQRINLYGPRTGHVVAEAEVSPGRSVIVDCQNPPRVQGTPTLSHLLATSEWYDYSTLNLRRLHLSWLFERVKLRSGIITFWGENPQAMLAALWYSLFLVLVAARAGRYGFRKLLHRRGWQHLSSRHPEARAPSTGMSGQSLQAAIAR